MRLTSTIPAKIQSLTDYHPYFIQFIIVGVLVNALHDGIYLALEDGIGFNYNMAYTISIPGGIAPVFVFPIAIIINFFMVRFAFKK